MRSLRDEELLKMKSRARPIRSALFVPADRVDMMRKAAGFGADALILDLEDGVAEQAREHARARMRGIVGELGAAGQTIIVRVNGIESGLTGFDLEAVTCPHLYAVMVAKIAGTDQVKEAAHLLNFFERKNGVDAGAILIWPLLETAEGIYRAYEVGAASPRVAHMGGVGGSGDVGRALGYKVTPEGLETLYLLSKVLLEARAGVPFPIGGAGAGENIKDVKGIRAGALRARQLGYTGSMLLHPAGIAVVNEVFTPSNEELQDARDLIAAVEAKFSAGSGVATHRGRMVDAAHLKTARAMIQWAESIKSRKR
jgi:citrate lyase subunit beta / citryl-CoA lyase